MLIGVDARLAGYRRGMGQFVYNVLRELLPLAPQHEFVLYIDDPATLEALPRRAGARARLLRPGFYPFWEQVALPLAARADRVDLLYAPANTAPLLRTSRQVVTVHDVMYLLPAAQLPRSPSLYQQLGRIYRNRIVPGAVRRANHIVTVSHFSRHDITTHLKRALEDITVVYEAANPFYQLQSELSGGAALRAQLGEGPFIFTLGAIDPRKNTERVIAAFAGLRARQALAHRLVIAGLNEAARARFAETAARQGVADQVTLLGFVSEEELLALYNLAELFVYPSLYEGFGLPLLEAMACGVPVVTSNVTSIPEIAGDAALLVDPLDVPALTAAMERVLTEPGLRDELRRRGFARAATFSWERAARELLAVFEKVARQ